MDNYCVILGTPQMASSTPHMASSTPQIASRTPHMASRTQSAETHNLRSMSINDNLEQKSTKSSSIQVSDGVRPNVSSNVATQVTNDNIVSTGSHVEIKKSNEIAVQTTETLVNGASTPTRKKVKTRSVQRRLSLESNPNKKDDQNSFHESLDTKAAYRYSSVPGDLNVISKNGRNSNNNNSNNNNNNNKQQIYTIEVSASTQNPIQRKSNLKKSSSLNTLNDVNSLLSLRNPDKRTYGSLNNLQIKDSASKSFLRRQGQKILGVLSGRKRSKSRDSEYDFVYLSLFNS